MDNPQIYNVSDINRLVKDLLEENIPTIWLEGEVSNFKAHYSGHYYFTLKDPQAQISAVMWRSRAAQLDFKLEDGQKVQVLGNIRVYEKSGRYQIDIIRMQPAGLGNLQQQFEALKRKLDAEGLFAPENKQTIPAFPAAIGVVTSATGATIRDILDVLQRRAPQVSVFVCPAKVQGQGAAEEIAHAIELLNRFGKVDVLIVGRGGGSLEDLWAFNEEVVARAIFNSKRPVISAVGHEIDFTIADFAADLRAATPSVAAELAVPDQLELKGQLAYFDEKLRQITGQNITRQRTRLDNISASYGLRRVVDRIHQSAIQVDELHNRLNLSGNALFRQQKDNLRYLAERLDSLNPRSVLRRGYSITYHKGKPVTNAGALQEETILLTELSSGKIESTVNRIEEDS